MDNKKRFRDIYLGCINRIGSDKLLEWLEKSDFFTAPASSKFHNACEGGLVDHSLNVYDNLVKLNKEFQTGYSEETLAIVGLLHDLCKVNFYKIDYRNVKDESGKWSKVPYYTIDEEFPFGHGEKSCYIIQAYMQLKREECLAIRWHMAGFDASTKGGDYSGSRAYEKSKLCSLVSSADMLATYIDEVRKENE